MADGCALCCCCCIQVMQANEVTEQRVQHGFGYKYDPPFCIVQWGTSRLCMRVRLLSRDGLATVGAHAHKGKNTTHLCCIAVPGTVLGCGRTWT